ncbi:MAG: EAL domain-containing protein [Pseudomonadota bacterium]
MRLTCLSLTTIAFLLFSVSSLAIEFTEEERAFILNNPKIIVGGETDWPPMDYVENGEYTGAALDYLNEISAITGLEIDLVVGPTWGELMGMIRRQEIDFLPMMYWTESRAREFHMTLPYITIRHYVFMKGKRPDIRSLEDLYGLTMAIPSGYASIEYLSEFHPEINILETTGVVDAMDAVLIGDADAVVESTASIAYYASSQSIIGLEPAFKVRFESNNLAMAVRSDWPILRDIIQKALNEISAERATAIMAKWSGSEAAAKTFLTASAEFTEAESTFLKRNAVFTACVNTQRMPLESSRNNVADGMASDYLAALGATLNVNFSVRGYESWRNIETAIQRGECDLATLGRINRTANTLAFSPAHITEKLALATHSRSGFVDDLRSLPDGKVGYVNGYVDLGLLENRSPNVEFVAYDSLQAALNDVVDNELYGVIDLMSAVNYAIHRRADSALRISGIFLDDNVRFGVASAGNRPLLSSTINKAISAMPPALATNVHQKWVAVTIEKETDYTLLWQSMLVAGVILLVVLSRVIELRRHREEINQKNQTLHEINAKLEAQHDSALHMAYHDQLTGLPNRAKLMQDLDYAMKVRRRENQQLAVLFIDLDRFKPVNDTLGHAVGDKLLKLVARKLSGLLRETDHLCRLGGDEFVVILPNVANSYNPSLVAQRIIDLLSATMIVDEHVVNIGCSVGIAMVPDDSDDLHSVIKCADSAMYTAKQNGRNGYAFYREDLSNKMARRTQIENALRKSIDDQDFSLVFQPIVDLERQEVVKAEALIRWNHQTLGLVPPDEFIPIAEEVGLIVKIGDWVLRKACETMQQFIFDGVDIHAIAVNVSSVEFVKSDVPARFHDVLQHYGVKPEQIEIEMTERYMLEPSQGAENELQQLRDMGHTLCVDDFGTGYSSLSYMKQLPLNVVKIDRSFISDLPHDQNDSAISQAIISLSHNLGYKVVAEGVETREQLDFLVDKCCNYAQGYFLSKPVRAIEFAQAMRDIRDRLEQKDNWTQTLKVLRR